MRQLLDVISFFHRQNICHRDVKPDNILYDREKGKIWLIDLGISKFMVDNNVRKEMMTDTGTTGYKAPEMLEGGKYTENIDEWAAGVVLYEMVEKRLPFKKEYLRDSIQSILEIDYEAR
jgi:serine/threonine protein kinase